MKEKVIIFRSSSETRETKEHANLEQRVNELLEAGWAVKSVTMDHSESYATTIFVLQKNEE